MNSIKSCLLFVKATGLLLSGVPAAVETLAKDRIQSQYQQRYPNIAFGFDTAGKGPAGDCENKGVYEVRDESILLRAENVLWPGERSYPLTNVIDGDRLEFPAPLLELSPETLPPPPPPNRARWVVPALLATGIAVTISVLLRPRHSQQPADQVQPTRVVQF